LKILWKCTGMKVLQEGRAVHRGRSANHIHNVFADHFMNMRLGNSQENGLKGIPLTNYCNNSHHIDTQGIKLLVIIIPYFVMFFLCNIMFISLCRSCHIAACNYCKLPHAGVARVKEVALTINVNIQFIVK
jgi:hypothetical protein